MFQNNYSSHLSQETDATALSLSLSKKHILILTCSFKVHLGAINTFTILLITSTYK